MKKRLIFLLVMLICFCLTAVLCACSETDSDEQDQQPHTHEYSEWNVVKAPTCSKPGEKTASCACGDVVTEMIDTLPHSYDENGVCTVCGDDYGASYGLEYKLSSAKDYYILTGLGACKDRDIVIPSTHNGLPVKRIDGFSVNDEIRSVVVAEGVELTKNSLEELFLTA